MSFSLKHFSVQMFVLIGLLASCNVLACTADEEFKGNVNEAVLRTVLQDKFDNLSIAAPKKENVHRHAQVSGSSSSEKHSSATHKNCQCCEIGSCANCVGCSGSCGTVTFSVSSNVEPANTPVGRFIQMQANYASLSPTPLEHPPK